MQIIKWLQNRLRYIVWACDEKGGVPCNQEDPSNVSVPEHPYQSVRTKRKERDQKRTSIREKSKSGDRKLSPTLAEQCLYLYGVRSVMRDRLVVDVLR